MKLGLLSRLGLGRGRGQAVISRTAGAVSRFRPGLEGLEDRITPATLDLPLAVSDLVVTGTGADRALGAIFSLGGVELNPDNPVPIAVATEDDPNDECPILNLEIGAIDLNLLGLQVETSDICLDVTATNDQGLLGGLLCDLSNGLGLGGILSQLGNRANRFLDRVDRLLDNVFGRAMDVTGVLGQPLGGGEVSPQQEDVCDILNLELGPVELRVPLLGVNVFLDNCEDPAGPVTVDVTADPEGGILGSLLCGLADGIDLDGLPLNQLLDQLDDLLDGALDLVDRFGDNLDRLGDRLERLFDRVERAIDRLEDRADRIIDRLEGTIERLEDLIDQLEDRGLDRLARLLERAVGRLEDILGGLLP